MEAQVDTVVVVEAAAIPSPEVERIKPDDSHDAQKWLKLSACVPGSPAKITRSVNILALADGGLTLEGEIAKMQADAIEYAKRADFESTLNEKLKSLGVKNV